MELKLNIGLVRQLRMMVAYTVLFSLIGRTMCYRLVDTKSVDVTYNKTHVARSNYKTEEHVEKSIRDIGNKSTVLNETVTNGTLNATNDILQNHLDAVFLTAGGIDQEYITANSSDNISFSSEGQDKGIDFFEPSSDTTAILIVGPAAAVGIFLFLCVAFYFHNLQLNNRYKRNKHLMITMYVSACTDDDMDNNNIQLKPSPPSLARTRSVSPAPGRLVPIEGDLKSHRRKSLAPPHGLPPPGPGKVKRSTSVSPGVDKDLLTASAAKRKQSVFIL